MDEFNVFLSFEEAPVDEYDPSLDDDNSVLADAPWANPNAKALSPKAAKSLRNKLEQAAALKLSTTPIRKNVIVPHPRDLKNGSIGWDVYALQRALAVAKMRKWGVFTRTFGNGTTIAVKNFQKLHGLAQDGVYGVATHKKLALYYDANGIRLINKVKLLTASQTKKSNLLSAAMVLYNRGAVVHYTQGPARMWIVHNHYSLGMLSTMNQDYEDCSSSITGLRYVSKLSDPNGFDFNGYGFTGSMADHGVKINPQDAVVGDCYLYGSYPFEHVTMNVGRGRAFSNGGEFGPNLVSPYYRSVSVCKRYPGLPVN